MSYFGGGMFLIGVVVFAVVQISVIKALPRTMVNLIAYWPFLGAVANFLCSGIILFFTGIGNFIGFVNMASSVLVLIWLFGYKRFYGLNKVKIKLFRYVIPYPIVEQENSEESWLF